MLSLITPAPPVPPGSTGVSASRPLRHFRAWFHRGIFGTTRAKSRRPTTADSGYVGKTQRFYGVGRRGLMAWVLPSPVVSINVFRAAILSIVLTLAAGQNIGLLCHLWCPPDAATTSGCEHQTTTSPSLTPYEVCNEAVSDATAIAREEGRRTAAPHGQSATVVPRFAFAAPSFEARSGYEPDCRRLLDARPLVLALRI